MNRRYYFLLGSLLPLIAGMAGCSSGGGGSATDTDTDVGQTVSDVSVAPAGQVTHYGTVSIGDENGLVSDLLGSFFRLDSGVSESFMVDMVSGSTTMCLVQDDGVLDFEEISTGYVPNVPGVGKVAVSAGDSVVLTSSAGTFATLTEQPAAGFLFYELSTMSLMSDTPVPEMLTVAIPGSSEIPAIQGAAVPSVTPLTGFSYTGETAVTGASQFSWDVSQDENAFVRIFSTTAGGFFLENGVTVTCITPDTGSFTFPETVRNQLGADFQGTQPIASRIVANTVQTGSTILYVLRESFAVD